MSIGHVHLKVADLNRAIAFYCGVLGFDLMQRYGHEAAFLSAGGYHHHIALPLSASAIAVLEELPRFDRGDYLFSTTFGAGSARDHAGAKLKLDRLKGEQLGFSHPPFVIHDLRRTVRTGLAALRVPDHIAEMVLGHGRRGLQRVYDQYSYENEVREALELWSGRLRELTERMPNNVVRLRASHRVAASRRALGLTSPGHNPD